MSERQGGVGGGPGSPAAANVRERTCPSHAVHGVVGQQPAGEHAPRLHRRAGRQRRRGEGGGGVRGGVHVLAVLHLVRQPLPVDVEAGDAGVGGQDVPLELAGGDKSETSTTGISFSHITTFKRNKYLDTNDHVVTRRAPVFKRRGCGDQT